MPSSRAATSSEVEGDIFDRYGPGAPVPGGLASVRVLAPVLPSKIVAVGLDHLDHAVEPGKPRPTSSPSFRPSYAACGRYHFDGDTGRHRSARRRGCRHGGYPASETWSTR